MIKDKKEVLDDIATKYVCSLDGGLLTVAWHAEENCYVLRCGKGHYPEEVTRQPSLTELHKQGEELPEPIKSNVVKGIAKRQGKAAKPGETLGMQLIPSTDLGTGERLPVESITAIIDYAGRYELDPYRGHIVIMYGKPYISIDGYLYHARQTNNPYKMVSHPLSEQERKDYQVPVGAHAWLTNITKLVSGSEFTGLGIVTAEEMTAKSPRDATKLRSPVVAAHPWQLAQKRAEWQALRRAFPIGESEELPPKDRPG